MHCPKEAASGSLWTASSPTAPLRIALLLLPGLSCLVLEELGRRLRQCLLTPRVASATTTTTLLLLRFPSSDWIPAAVACSCCPLCCCCYTGCSSDFGRFPPVLVVVPSQSLLVVVVAVVVHFFVFIGDEPRNMILSSATHTLIHAGAAGTAFVHSLRYTLLPAMLRNAINLLTNFHIQNAAITRESSLQRLPLALHTKLFIKTIFFLFLQTTLAYCGRNVDTTSFFKLNRFLAHSRQRSTQTDRYRHHDHC